MSTATNSTKLRANRIRLWISLMLIGVVLLSACQQAATPTAEPTAEPTAAPAATQTPEPPAATEPAE